MSHATKYCATFEILLIFALKLFAFENIKIAPPYKIVTYQLL